jgi:hypothetical protein
VLRSGAGGVAPESPTVGKTTHDGPSNMNAFMGWGGLSAGISSSGEIAVLRYPSPSYYDKTGYLTLMRTLPRMGALPNMGSFFGMSREGEDGVYAP